MGLDAGIRAFFKKYAPGAFQADHAVGHSNRPWVFINEVATSLYKDLPVRSDDETGGLLTPLQYCEQYFIKPCLDMLTRAEFSVAVCVLDNQDGIKARVGNLKDKERERRIKRTIESTTEEEDAESARYTRTTTVSPHGDQLIDEESDDKSPFLINPRIVVRHYHLLEKLWDYCLQHLATWEFVMREFPFNKTLIMDHNIGGPHVYHRHIQGISIVIAGHLYHCISEGDVATVFWSKIFKGLNVLIRTTDSDVQLIMARFAHYHRNQPDLFTIIENQFSLKWNLASSEVEFEPQASGKGVKRKITPADLAKKEKAYDNKRQKAAERLASKPLVCIDVLKLARILRAFSATEHKNYLKKHLAKRQEKWEEYVKENKELKKLKDPVLTADETLLMNMNSQWISLCERINESPPFDNSLTLSAFFRECNRLIDNVDWSLSMDELLMICVLFGGNDFIDKSEVTHAVGFYSGKEEKQGFFDWFNHDAYLQTAALRELTEINEHNYKIFRRMMLRFYYDCTTSRRKTHIPNLERPFVYLSYCQRVSDLKKGGFVKGMTTKGANDVVYHDEHDKKDVTSKWGARFFEMFVDEKSEAELAHEKAKEKTRKKKNKERKEMEDDENTDDSDADQKQEGTEEKTDTKEKKTLLSILTANGGSNPDPDLTHMGTLRKPLEAYVEARLTRIFQTFITITQYWKDTYELQPPRFLDPYEPIAMDILCGPLDTRTLIANGNSP